MQKLIKLNDQHYIIVDDSEIKEGDFYYDTKGDPGYKYCKKITHSTEPLEEDVEFIGTTPKIKLGFVNIKPLSLSEVEEAINGYSVEKMFNTKDKLTIDIDVFKTIAYAFFSLHRTNEFDDEELELEFQRILNNNIQSLLPKTEWGITIDEQGKIKLV